MTWLVPDPWQKQFFKNVTPSFDIPVADPYAYEAYPSHRWVYNKLLFCESQDVRAFPHGIVPTIFPVFSKPIFNLYGLGIGAKVLDSWDDTRDYQPGHFLMPVLYGNHYSIDAAIIDGILVWHVSMEGEYDETGFTKWHISPITTYVENLLRRWCLDNLRGYTGMINVEMRGTVFLECHLRFSNQFVDLYGGDNFLKAVVNLYENGIWNYPEITKTLFSYVIRSDQPGVYSIDNDTLIKAKRFVSSIQLMNEEEQNKNDQYRVAIVNGFTTRQCEEACAVLKNNFRVTPLT